ncbi:MAG: hypothetical protein ACFFG0_20690 [Candidatus Thorarchaeota archaeon]
MSIDKWLSKEGSKEKEMRKEESFKNLSEGEITELKKKKIRRIAEKGDQNSTEIIESDNFLQEILKFKEWLNQRTYLKGDIDKIETWITNLYSNIEYEAEFEAKLINFNDKKSLIEDYKIIPPKFLDEKTRIAINKKIHGMTRTNSDNYYLRKLRSTVKEKLIESKYYEILDKILHLY